MGKYVETRKIAFRALTSSAHGRLRLDLMHNQGQTPPVLPDLHIISARSPVPTALVSPRKSTFAMLRFLTPFLCTYLHTKSVETRIFKNFSRVARNASEPNLELSVTCSDRGPPQKIARRPPHERKRRAQKPDFSGAHQVRGVGRSDTFDAQTG